MTESFSQEEYTSQFSAIKTPIRELVNEPSPQRSPIRKVQNKSAKKFKPMKITNI